MGKPLDPAFFAVVGRQLLIGLDFVPADRKAFWTAYWGTPALAIATELCRTHPEQMAALRDRIEGKPQPKAAVTPQKAAAPFLAVADVRAAEARLEQQDAIAQKFQTGPYACDAPRTTTYDPKTGIQRFGVGVAR